MDDLNGRKGWTVDEFRQIYGLGRNNALNIVHMKGFPAVRFGRRIVILADKVDAFMQERIMSRSDEHERTDS